MAPFKIPFGKKPQVGGGGIEIGISGGGPPVAEPSVEPPLTQPPAITKTSKTEWPKTPDQIAAIKLAEAQKETASIYHKLMDNMEESVPKNGMFFLKLGDKETIHGDNRVLILTEGRNNTAGKFEYVAITSAGAKKLILDKQLYGSDLHYRPSNYKYFYDYGDQNRAGTGSLSFENGTQIEVSPIDDADQGFVKEAMTKSIEKSQATSENAKNKAALDAEQQKQAAARELSGLFSKAIQPPAGEGSTAPPPPAPTA